MATIGGDGIGLDHLGEAAAARPLMQANVVID